MDESMKPHTIYPPWSDEQIAALNTWQRLGVVHPFTCPVEGHRADLVAHEDGWHCPQCDYRQTWAPAVMLEADKVVAWLKGRVKLGAYPSLAGQLPKGWSRT